MVSGELLCLEQAGKGKLFMSEKIKSPMSRTDKLCLAALAGVVLAASLLDWSMDAAAYRAAEVDKPKLELAEVVPPVDCTPFVEAVQAMQAEPYNESVPLSRELQRTLQEACASNGVPVCLALGLIEVESGFQADANNGVCIGLMQTNEKYAARFEEASGCSIYTPEGNIRGGVWYLGVLLERYENDTPAALVAYNQGSYKGIVTDYAKNVLRASEKWGNG